MAEEIKTTVEGAPKAKHNSINQLESIAKTLPTEIPTPVPAPKALLSDLEVELKAIELESAKLKLELDKANLIDMKERLAERELKRESIRQEAHTKGATIKATKDGEARQQAHCNHKKGGNGAQGVVGGQGDDSQFAVLKHTFANGDMWIRCLRCGKTWKPPVKSEHTTQASYDAALGVYREAVNFQTRNVASKGVIFQYSDGGEFYRENTKNATLR